MADEIKKETYESSVQLPAGLEPYNKQDYALMDAHYVWVKDDEGDEGIRLDEKLKNVGMSQEVQESIDKLGNTVKGLSDNVDIISGQLETISGQVDLNKVSISEIKEQLEGLDPEKLGKIYRTFYNTETYIFYFYQIPPEEEENEPSQAQVDKIIEDAEYYVYQVEIKGGGGALGVTLPKIRLERIFPNKSPIYIKKDSALSITTNYYGYYLATESEPETPYDDVANLTLSINEEVVESKMVTNGSYTFDIGNYLKIGENKVKIVASITGLEAADGTSLKVSAPLTWIVNVVDLTISAPSFNSKALYTYPIPVSVPCSVVGVIDKTLHYIIDDGIEITKPLGTRSPSDQSVAFMNQTTSHGDHSIKIWATGEIEGEEIKSNVLYFNSMYILPDETTPILRSDYDGSDLRQYDTKTFEFSVYNPEKKNTPVEIYINGELQTIINAENGVSQSWAYRPMTSGSFDLMIKISDTIKKEWHINVVDFGEDISEISGAVYDFNPSLINKNNTDSDKNIYIYSSPDGNDYSFKASDDFDWYNGGWKTDENGVKYFHIMRGTSVTIDYKLFESRDWRATGKNFKIIFQTEKCKKMDANVMKCLSSSNNMKIGVEIDAQNAYLYGNDCYIKGQYMEDELTELEFNINNEDNGFSEYTIYNNCDPIQANVYLASSSFSQTTHSGGLTNAVQNIVIGSDNCDIKLYRFKVYERYLSMEETFQNYVADSLDSIERAEKISRNDIFNDTGSDEYNGLDIDKIAEKHPKLRMIFIECDRFTEGKSYPVKNCTVTQRLGNNDPKHNWIARNVTLKGQGTSSEFYGPSGRNLDLEFLASSLITDSEGNQYAFESTLNKLLKFNKYAMTDNSIPINYVNIKVNVASSENANNAVLAEEYNEYQPYVRPMRKRDPRVRDTMEFHPCIVFVKETNENVQSHVEFKDFNWHFYACGDFGNSKKNGNAMGMWLESDVPQEELPADAAMECIIEFATNDPLQSFLFPSQMTTFPTINVSNDGKISDSIKQGDIQVWDKNFEFRYPDIKTFLNPNLDPSEFEKHKNAIEEIGRLFKEMWDWVNSTDTTAATNRTIPSITYSNYTTPFTRDTKEYRIAKFKNEFTNYFVADSILYHYLFTERHTMVDNRAKNVFIHLNVEPGEYYKKWDVVFDYDNDTAEGCDNSGILRFPYGKEDIDKDEYGKSIFNADNSVLWVNVRNYLANELTELMNQSGVQDFYQSSNVISNFDKYQWIKPERLEMMDMWRKYYRPWEEIKNVDYFQKLYGRKQFQRRRYETYQGIYINSKYKKLDSTNSLAIRSYRKDFVNKNNKPKPLPSGFEMNPYCDLYCTVITDTTAVTKRRGKANEITIIPFYGDPDTYGDKNIQIPIGNYYNSIGDLAPLYPQGQTNLATGTQLKEILYGYDNNEIPNNNLTNAGISKSTPMIEYLDLRRNTLENNGRAIDATTARNLKYINTTGTNVSAVTFCNGGLLEEAYLNAISELTIMNLLRVKVFECESYSSLTKLIYENCNSVINIVDILNKATNLNEVELLNIDLNFENTNILNRLCDVVSSSKLTGIVRVPRLRPSEQRRYQEKWGDNLTVIGNLTKEYYVSFYNYDGTLLMNASGTRLMENIPYDEGSVIKSPLVTDNDALPENDRVLPIYQTNTPTKPETAKYTYTFKGWGTSLGDDENIINLNNIHIQSDMQLYAKYKKEVRMYSVVWKNALGNILNASSPVKVQYGQEAVFNPDLYGGYPSKESDGSIYFLFENWKESTGYVTQDMEVEPVFLEGRLDMTKPSTEYNAADVKAIIQNYRKNPDPDFLSLYLNTDSIVNVQMGYMPSFNNVEEEIFAQNYDFNGTVNTVKDTGIKLMQLIEDPEGKLRYRNWTMALDITFDNTKANNYQTFAYCKNVLDLSMPFSNSQYSIPEIKLGNLGTSSSIKVSTDFPKTLDNGILGANNEKVDVKVRENIIIKYSYDTGFITIFSNDKDSDKRNVITTQQPFSPNITETPDNFGTLILGAAPYTLSSSYRYYSKGTINIGKIWWDDLGDEECKKIVSWTYNKQPMIFVGTGVYDTPSGGETLASFVCYGETLNAKHKYDDNSSSGGWKYSGLNKYLNNKVLFGVNPTWKQLITETNIKSMRGGKDGSDSGFQDKDASLEDLGKNASDVLISPSYLYVPSAYEVNVNIGQSYISEVNNLYSYPCYIKEENRRYIAKNYGTNSFYQPWATRTPDPTSSTTDQIKVVNIDGTISNSIAVLNNSNKRSLYPFITNAYSSATQPMYVVFGFSIG